jgi:hypothetical protein
VAFTDKWLQDDTLFTTIEFAFGWQNKLLHPRQVVSMLFCSSYLNEQKFQAQ